MRLTFTRLVLLSAVVVVTLAWVPLTTWLAVDACLDAGGSYDHVLSRCDHDLSHPGPIGMPISFRDMGTAVAVGALATGLLMLAFIRQDKRHRASQ